jgi:hypothetical protein
VSMHRRSPTTDRRSSSARRVRVTRAVVLRVSLAAALGVLAALLVACSSSGKGLIPTGDAGPLQGDFETVAQAAESGGGNCAATESALLKTDRDFAALPSIDAGLHNTLRQGIENLRTRALALCTQPLPQATETTTAPRTTTSTTTATTPPETQTTPTTPPTTPSPSGPGGGTPAPGEEGSEEEGLGLGKGEGAGKGHNGRGNSGGTQPEAGGQEVAK